MFFEIWRKPSRYDSQRGSVQSYLATLARSRAVDRARKLHNESARKLQLTGQTIVRHLAFRETDSTHLEVEGREEREHILRAFEGLAELQRELMKMAFFDLMSHSEIATVTKLPIGTIKSRIRRALVRLRDLLA